MEWVYKLNQGVFPAFRWRLLLCLMLLFTVTSARAELSLKDAVAAAQSNDPWLEGSVYRENALTAQGSAASSLPDPMLSIGMANLPTDTFNFDQEAMTQFKVGLTQTIPRGSSRELNTERFAILGSQQPYLRAERKARVGVAVSHLWFDAYRATQTIRLIKEDRELFEHLVDVAQSSYASGIGKTRQQDIIRAQLELTRLEDRLTVLQQSLEESRSRLGEWLLPRSANTAGQWRYLDEGWGQLPERLPDLTLAKPELVRISQDPTPGEIGSVLLAHPAIQSLDMKIAASATDIEIAEQDYKPQWKVNASYGYRDDAPDGMERADFFSVGVAFDLPLFTTSRQDQKVRSAVANSESVRTERALLLRKMVSDFAAQRSRLIRLEERRELYRKRLLSELHEQAEASLSAYTNDDGDFAEVIRSRIDELNAQIDVHNIEIDRLKTIAQLNYYLVQDEIDPAGGKL